MSRTNQRVAVFALVGLLFVGAAFLLYTNIMFRVVAKDPAGGILPTSQNFIKLTFNKPLANKQPEGAITFSGGATTYKISDKTIYVYFVNNFEEDKLVELKLTNIQSSGGKMFSHNYRFMTRYVDFNRLSEEAQQSDVQASDSFEEGDPLLDKLPYENESFSIDYGIPNISDKRVPLYIASKEINYNDPLAEAGSASYLVTLRDARTKAVAWLGSNGYKEDGYVLVFAEPYLIEEFKGVYIKNYDVIEIEPQE